MFPSVGRLSSIVLLTYLSVFTSAPFIFTKVLQTHCKTNGIDIVLYLDDGLRFNKDLLTCVNESNFVQETFKLVQAGLLINTDASIFQPTQCLEWLGLVWDSHLFSLIVYHRGELQTLMSQSNFLLADFLTLQLATLARRLENNFYVTSW